MEGHMMFLSYKEKVLSMLIKYSEIRPATLDMKTKKILPLLATDIR